jgi:hypothetical protein
MTISISLIVKLESNNEEQYLPGRDAVKVGKNFPHLGGTSCIRRQSQKVN